MKSFKFKQAINYSGYRENQSPFTKTYPSKKQILEDLLLLEGEFYYLRIYDCSPHAYRTLEVIEENNLDFKVMLGLYLSPEENHINHPFFYVHEEKVLLASIEKNNDKVKELLALYEKYENIVSAISIGNETRSIWNNSRVSIDTLVNVTKTIKENTDCLVTFCEEYQTWIEELEPLAKEVDFISLHTYPAWQGCKIEEGLEVAVKNFNQVQNKYTDKYCIITETGWPTNTHGARIKKEDANIENQKIFNSQITKWGQENNTLIYLFEAFDEPWKGENNPEEPEKNWGIYTVGRKRK